MRPVWKITILMAVIVACIAIAGCATTSPPGTGTPTATPTVGTGGQGADWPMTNYDPTMSRSSPQTIIGKNNVANLKVKWILNTNYPIEARHLSSATQPTSPTTPSRSLPLILIPGSRSGNSTRASIIPGHSFPGRHPPTV